MDTEQNYLFVHHVNQKKKPYDTSHSGLSLKTRHCLIFGKIKKTTCEGSLIAHVS